eukprot:COSAG06_NODE_16511_length_997_cov_1.136971_1_plen_88_part_10
MHCGSLGSTHIPLIGAFIVKTASSFVLSSRSGFFLLLLLLLWLEISWGKILVAMAWPSDGSALTTPFPQFLLLVSASAARLLVVRYDD